MTATATDRICPRCNIHFTPRSTTGLAVFIYVLVICGLLALQRVIGANVLITVGVWAVTLAVTRAGVQRLATTVQETCPSCGSEQATPASMVLVPPTVPAPASRWRVWGGRLVSAVVFLVCVVLSAAWWFRDVLQTDEQVHAKVEEAQRARYMDGRQRLAVEFDLSGEVSAVDAANATITMWGIAWPLDAPKDARWDQVEGWTQEKSTLVVRSVNPASTSVGRGVRSKAYFVERRAVPERAGQPPVYEWIYDMEERAALKRLRQAASEGR